MKRKRGTRTLAFLLSFVMVASFVPVPAFAEASDEVGEAAQQVAGVFQELSTQELVSGDLMAAGGHYHRNLPPPPRWRLDRKPDVLRRPVHCGLR